MSDGQYSVCAPIYVRAPGRTRRVTVLVDGGPKIISAVCDGAFADGGEDRQYGWTRFCPYLSDVNSHDVLRSENPAVKGISVYLTCLRVSKAVALHRRDPDKPGG